MKLPNMKFNLKIFKQWSDGVIGREDRCQICDVSDGIGERARRKQVRVRLKRRECADCSATERPPDRLVNFDSIFFFFYVSTTPAKKYGERFVNRHVSPRSLSARGTREPRNVFASTAGGIICVFRACVAVSAATVVGNRRSGRYDRRIRAGADLDRDTKREPTIKTSASALVRACATTGAYCVCVPDAYNVLLLNASEK
ncbi:hypothetical protein EVAR_23499_1 [Eumeta japonica]|uniref:Uncharacterized protein n=1 Tax=Eumeta variegata TaxID=151549 RepID=A0A4C1W0H1_EUMVA|nr:hypothetical protein EVAR_23499_1 [Eumeta japonica]